MQNVIIYLIGFAGAGKYTIAQELAKLEPFTIADNHLINNPIFTVVGADGKTRLSPNIWKEVAKVRHAVYDAITHVAPKTMNFILTNRLAEYDSEDKKIYLQVEAIAKNRNSHFFPIRILCDKEMIAARIVQEERKFRFKQIVPEIDEYYEIFEVLKPDHPCALELDVSSITAREAADRILQHVRKHYD